MPTINIKTKWSFLLLGMPLKVFINKLLIGSIKNGKEETFVVEPGNVSMQVKSGIFNEGQSQIHQFDLRPESKLHLVFQPNIGVWLMCFSLGIGLYRSICYKSILYSILLVSLCIMLSCIFYKQAIIIKEVDNEKK